MNKRMKKIVLGIACVLGGLIVVVAWGGQLLHQRWKNLLSPAERGEPYMVAVDRNGNDSACVYQLDTAALRVVMIGDSWAGLHAELGYDTLMTHLLTESMQEPVHFVSKGRGGAKSKDVYRFMFSSLCTPDEMAAGYCTQPLIESAPHYCIVMAGINDAAACLGSHYYIENYRLIIAWLLENGIKPVVVEMPDVNIRGLYGGKPLNDYLVDCLRSWLTHCTMYSVTEYSEALRSMLVAQGLMGHVVYIPKDAWNADGYQDPRNLYLSDEIHLNAKGYHLLDSCIASYIAQDK